MKEYYIIIGKMKENFGGDLIVSQIYTEYQKAIERLKAMPNGEGMIYTRYIEE